VIHPVVRVAAAWLGCLLVIATLHVQLNRGGVAEFFRGDRGRLLVGHLPVTCHLTCPVTSWVTSHSARGSIFESRRFTNFAAMTEAFQAGDLQAAFILAPLAMTMRRRGMPIKIVYLGHRDGTTVIVRRDDPIRDFAGLRHRRVAIPHRYSNQRILIQRLMDQYGFADGDIDLVEYPPPDMPSGLRTGQFDAFVVGEPFGARTELDGYGRVLAYTKDIWPNFISCVLAVREDLIRARPDVVQELVNGIARSGLWLDAPGTDLTPGVVVAGDGAPPDPRSAVLPAAWPRTHRMQAAVIAARREYYSQSPDLLRFVLSHPPDRVRYVDLVPARADFEEIQRYAERLGFFRPSTPGDPYGFNDYVDPTFAARAQGRVLGSGAR
jgi:NitT/TauT family transport system substrate-binding protein